MTKVFDYPDRETLDMLQAGTKTKGAWVLGDGYVFLIDYKMFVDGHVHFVEDYMGAKYGVAYIDATNWDELDLDPVDEEVWDEAYRLGSLNEGVIEAWGWVRLLRGSALMREFTSIFLRRAAKGFKAMWGDEAWEITYTIDSLHSPRGHYATDVPLDVLSAGHVQELMGYM